MLLSELHQQQGAQLAADGIPLHYGDLAGEYHAALQEAVLMDRSHEARLLLNGADRLKLLQRMSTNDVLKLAENEGCPTLFTNPNARILERAFVYRRGENTLVISEPGRGEALRQYLQRNIFFNDAVGLSEITAQTNLLALHGPQADTVIENLFGVLPEHGLETTLEGGAVFVGRRKPVSGRHWIFVVAAEQAAAIWGRIMETGRAQGLRPAGSLTYNTLRIRAGRPAAGRELSPDYIPLEIGLWDEVNFHKGCYTGQEIIARMESRRRLARTIVQLSLSAAVDAPAELSYAGHAIGRLTSSVTTPDGEHMGIGVVKVSAAVIGLQYNCGQAQATVSALAGAQPLELLEEKQ
ncbi:MAG: folate-binding protein YgfZ [Chloroflexi bacterium]|nr:folate-binding protein YgfZ [Chloroflexota bacterium]